MFFLVGDHFDGMTSLSASWLTREIIALAPRRFLDKEIRRIAADFIYHKCQ